MHTSEAASIPSSCPLMLWWSLLLLSQCLVIVVWSCFASLWGCGVVLLRYIVDCVVIGYVEMWCADLCSAVVSVYVVWCGVVLCSAVSCCAVLCCIILRCVVLCCVVLCCVVLCCVVLCCVLSLNHVESCCCCDLCVLCWFRVSCLLCCVLLSCVPFCCIVLAVASCIVRCYEVILCSVWCCVLCCAIVFHCPVLLLWCVLPLPYYFLLLSGVL